MVFIWSKDTYFQCTKQMYTNTICQITIMIPVSEQKFPSFENVWQQYLLKLKTNISLPVEYTVKF